MDSIVIMATMTDGDVVAISGQAAWVALQVCAPLLGIALVVGLSVSIFQAVTQIQEQTLVFIPKIVAVVGALAVFGPWMLNVMLGFTEQLILDIPNVVGR